MKTKQQVAVDLYGMVGVGVTKAEAKADATRKLEQATEGRYEARMLRFPSGYIGLIYRDLYGWNYSIMQPDRNEAAGYCLGGYETRQEAERMLRIHIAQNLIYVAEDNGLSVILDERDQREHAEYIGWQLRYREYKAQGYSDSDCHHMACENRPFCPPAV